VLPSWKRTGVCVGEIILLTSYYRVSTFWRNMENQKFLRVSLVSEKIEIIMEFY